MLANSMQSCPPCRMGILTLSHTTRTQSWSSECTYLCRVVVCCPKPLLCVYRGEATVTTTVLSIAQRLDSGASWLLYLARTDVGL